MAAFFIFSNVLRFIMLHFLWIFYFDMHNIVEHQNVRSVVKVKEERNKEKTITDLFGVEAEMSLQSVHFATSTENPYLNEHVQEDKE